jgi:acetylornithine deacetylase/succinyl-diaminopimelate desuccinylase-like protein
MPLCCAELVTVQACLPVCPPTSCPIYLSQWPGAGFGLALRTIVSNLWLFGSVFTHTLASDPTTAPMVRTTTAVTVVTGGLADNVMPTTATALVNHRIHPLDTVESVVEHDRKVSVGGGVCC